MPEEFEGGRFTLKTHLSSSNVFRAHYAGGIEKRYNQRSGKSRDSCDVFVFEELCFPNVFRPNTNEKPAFSVKFLRFRDGSVRTSGRPNRRNKTAFSKFFGLVWTLPEFC